MKPLIDADILLYEAGFGAQSHWEGEDPPPFERAQEMLERTVHRICESVEATEAPIFYLTGKGNFRYAVAKRSEYKKRPNNRKPFHHNNLKTFIKATYDYRIQDGLEADDLMAIAQTEALADRNTIICSRDKDLKQVPGWHYGWEANRQPEFKPKFVEGFGNIFLDQKNKLSGWGDKFLLCQMIMGDKTDTIPGLPNVSDVRAYTALFETKEYEQGLEIALNMYRAVYENEAEDALTETAQQVFLIRELNEDGTPKMWTMDWRPNV